MALFVLRAPPRLRFSSSLSIDGVFGVGGTASLAGAATARAVGAAALLRGINLAGSGVAGAQAAALLLKGLRLVGGAVAGATGSGSLNWNITPAPQFVFAEGDTYNLTATGPVGYAVGGVYAVDPGGSALPTGISLSDAGLLSESGASIGSTPGVVFAYFEPGALSTLTLHPTSTGTLPYHATVYPLEGVVPTGRSLVSPDDANLRGSVLSTWPDGSAQVIVVAGETAVTSGVQKTLRLRVDNSSGTALTAARIDAIVTDIAVNFGGGAQSITDFTSPLRTWWANASTICCRYVLGCGVGTMKAIIDIHAFRAGVSNRAFVEVVIENGQIDADAGTVTAPSSQTYTGATVTVNGGTLTLATVNSPSASMAVPNARNGGTFTGGHEPGRAWYCSGWVGGDPGIEVTHDTASLQAHPWFWRQAEGSSQNLQTKYAQSYDTYVPWASCRIRMPGMDNGSYDQQIALHTREQADYFLFGSKYARRAVLATGQALLTAALNWRHEDSPYEVPTRAQTTDKRTSNGTWPETTTEPRYGGSGTADGSHLPSVALVPFLCRPSPCFIELAQKELVWNQTDYTADTAGAHWYDQTRSRAWRLRNYAIAIFLTPDADSARKAGYRSMLRAEIDRDAAFLAQPWNGFKYLYDLSYTAPGDCSGSRPGFQGHSYMTWFVTMAYHAVASVKVLRNADQVQADAVADEVCVYPLRWVNDAPGASAEWRLLAYQPTLGVLAGGGTSIDQSPHNISAFTRNEMSGTVPTAPGSWGLIEPSDYNYSDASTDVITENNGSFAAQFMGAICAAVERDVPGAAEAWTRIYGTNGTDGGVSNLLAWRADMSFLPENNRWPRNR